MFNLMIRSVFLSIFTVFLVMTSPVMAGQDEGLYDPVPPEGSAFVRFVHAQADNNDELMPKINGRTRDGVRFGHVKPYGVIKNGATKISLGEASTEFVAAPGAHYTAILQNNALRVETDPEQTDPLKAQLIVYNLTARSDISLKTADGKVSVIGPLEAGKIQDRAVNPIKVSFAVYAGEEKFADLSDWPLERKNSYIIAVMEDTGGKGVAAYDRARISTE